MDLIASFHSHKIKSFHFFSVTGLLPENESLFFLFYSEANVLDFNVVLKEYSSHERDK